jgi:hypothetical protein
MLNAVHVVKQADSFALSVVALPPALTRPADSTPGLYRGCISVNPETGKNGVTSCLATIRPELGCDYVNTSGTTTLLGGTRESAFVQNAR